MSSTRERVLSAARELIEQGDGGTPNMSALARTVGISRQALYLHFPDRGSLLLALVAHVDEREDLQAERAAVLAAPDAAAQIRAWVRMQARRNPRIAPLARALDEARHTDQAAAAAWRDRTDNRMRGAAMAISRLGDEGRLHPSWTAGEAATLLWELTSFRVWDDLVNESGLAADRYVEIITATALAALAGPIRSQAPLPPVPGHGLASCRRRDLGAWPPRGRTRGRLLRSRAPSAPAASSLPWPWSKRSGPVAHRANLASPVAHRANTASANGEPLRRQRLS